MRAALLAVLCAACSTTSPVGQIRFHSQAPVWRVDDRVPFEDAPSERHFYRMMYKVDGAFARRTTRAMELEPHKRVGDINSLDEVPDSTWFTNRIGVRDMTLEELKRGANADPSPFDHKPWKILGAKVGGLELGFTIEDALKRKFILKFDMASMPEQETAAHIIVHRLLWAMGYNVPEDYLGFIDRKDLVISDKARAKGLDDAKLETSLKLVYHRDDGKIRALASLFLDGKIVGPYAREGVRADDPNDMIPHERRRSLRGQYPMFAWLDHTDMKEDNTLDVFAHGYVTHYLLDFGKALGVMGISDKSRVSGFSFTYDIPDALADLFTLGLRTHPYDNLEDPGLKGIGLFDAEHFDPGAWKSSLPYWPLLAADNNDNLWGAKLVMRFKPHELAAIVDEAQLSDPRARQYMIDTLLHRQRATGRYWFDRVAPLDQFTVEAQGAGAKLCFTDLTLSYMLRTSATTYAIDTFDRGGHRTGFAISVAAGAKGQTCTAVPLAGAYTIVRLRVQRDGKEMPEVVVHLGRDAGSRLAVIGLRRR